MNALNQVMQAYRNVQVTCSPGNLVVMLYDGALRFTREAAAAMDRADRSARGERISRAHAILELLLTTLEPEHEPLLAERLAAVYDYCMRRLMDANLRGDRSALDEVIRVLEPLRDAWEVAARRPEGQ
jgi:flagellar protein FliS